MDIIAELERNRRGRLPCPTCGLGIPCGCTTACGGSARADSGLRGHGPADPWRSGQPAELHRPARLGGVGVERIFPWTRPGSRPSRSRVAARPARPAYYLRDRIGKRAKVREQHRAVDEAQTMEKRAARKARRDDRRQAIRNKRDARKQAQTAAPSAPAAEPSQQEE